nr:ISL3 family transposase [Actinoplanes teichomyceticus]
MLGLERTVVEAAEIAADEAGEYLAVAVRPRKKAARRCGRCQTRAPWYNNGGGRRWWRGLDLGTLRVWLHSDAPRVNCPVHGPTVAAMPRARHGSRFTTAFEDTTAWLAAHASASAVAELLRTTWRAVSGIITRVVADRAGALDRLAGLTRIGIDEIAYRKGHRYLVVVVDHDSGRIVWSGEGRRKQTVEAFFAALGPQRAAALTHVSADGADWIGDVVAECAPQAVRCLDAFHAVGWVTDALDEVRRHVWNQLRGGKGRSTTESKAFKGARWALWKNPDRLNPQQKATLASIQATNRPLYRAYLLKEQFRELIQIKGDDGRLLLAAWLRWAGRSKIPAIVKVAKKIRRHPAELHNTLDSGPSNVQRPRRSHRHPPPRPDPTRLRLRQPERAHRHRRPHPRRPLPTPARPLTTHRHPRKQQESPKWLAQHAQLRRFAA